MKRNDRLPFVFHLWTCGVLVVHFGRPLLLQWAVMPVLEVVFHASVVAVVGGALVAWTRGEVVKFLPEAAVAVLPAPAAVRRRRGPEDGRLSMAVDDGSGRLSVGDEEAS